MRDEQSMFRSFEEFEREELRRMESSSVSVDAMIESLFGLEFDLEAAAAGPSQEDL